MMPPNKPLPAARDGGYGLPESRWGSAITSAAWRRSLLDSLHTVKPINQTIIAVVAVALVGCVEWHSDDPSPSQTNLPGWSQVQVGMTRQQVYALLGKPLRETEELAAWRGPQVKKRFPSDYPSTTTWREYEACFDAGGRVKGTRDFERRQ